MRNCLFIILFIIFSVQIQAQSIDFTNLPLVVIETNGQQMLDDQKITANMKIISNGSNQMNHQADSGNVYTGKWN